ncbi:hypothetical protein BKK79_07575 [Cupriavidus sp. USMAA2-4]|uniref:Lipoprotein n=1 Tax=Cupriavidus malaysiensis TaxID=367825 RepID=A0ABM6F1D4_9BURK|nr:MULTISPECIES: hypothetical protein [Cupriavidus]AOY91673.1 hypothetical protein BKK79_07575 [Cupriavidus sp. USMAA2-4]AOY98770.1 hypothetical protein BKK81_05355 [Cupriavidus sp. USMAHM13]AOZ05202.1 hypothetical protein BKK80_04705 [Cupriavidus malaysiensis]
MNARDLGRIGLLAAALAAAAGASLPAQAHGWYGRGRVGVGVYVGPGFYPYPYPYYYPGYYYPPAVVAEPSAPPQYIEQGDVDPAGIPPAAAGGAPDQGPSYWYHCSKPEGYYPYIKACPGGWQQVPAQPPSSRADGAPPPA